MRRFTLHWIYGNSDKPRNVSGVNVADACRREGLNSQILESLDHWNEQHVENEPNCQCHECYHNRKKAATN